MAGGGAGGGEAGVAVTGLGVFAAGEGGAVGALHAAWWGVEVA